MLSAFLRDPAGEGKLFLSIHFYDPYTFTLMEEPATWGEPAPTWGTDMEKSEVEARLNQLGDCSESKGIPVILGEFAVTRGQNVMRESQSRILQRYFLFATLASGFASAFASGFVGFALLGSVFALAPPAFGSGLQWPPLHFTSQLALAAHVVWHFPPLQSTLAVALAATLL